MKSIALNWKCPLKFPCQMNQMDQMNTLCLWLTPLLPVVNCALAHFQHMGEFADNSEEYQNEDSSSKKRHNRHRKEGTMEPKPFWGRIQTYMQLYLWFHFAMNKKSNCNFIKVLASFLKEDKSLLTYVINRVPVTKSPLVMWKEIEFFFSSSLD